MIFTLASTQFLNLLLRVLSKLSRMKLHTKLIRVQVFLISSYYPPYIVWSSPSTWYPPVPCWLQTVLWTDTRDMTLVWPPGSGTGRTVPGRSDTCYSRTWWHWAGAAPPYYWSPPRWSGSADSGEAVCKITVKTFQYPSNYLQSSVFFHKFNGSKFGRSFQSTGEAASKVIATPTTYMCISFLH